MSTASQPVGLTVARDPWARAVFDVLVETAGRYNGLIVYSDLAEIVQERTGLRTRMEQRNWIGKVLSDVVHRCDREGLPALTALVVHKHDGQVGPGYDEVLRVAGMVPISDQVEREQHAAVARLECYRRWCDHVPSDAKPTLTGPVARQAARQQQAKRATRSMAICPRCFIEMPASGRCGECDG